MPTPGNKEKKKDFISRCIPIVISEGKPKDQAIAICHSIWERKHKSNKSEVIESLKSKLDELKTELETVKKSIKKNEITIIQPNLYSSGLFLNQNHTKYIYDGDKSLVLRSSEEEISNQRLLLFDDEFAYGYITLEKPFKIENWEEFRNYKEKHQTTTDEWIENGWSFPLFAYGVISSDFFNQPKGIITPVLKSDILNEADRYINDTGEIRIEDRIEGD